VRFGARTLSFLIGEAYAFPVGRIAAQGFVRKGAVWESLIQGFDLSARADRTVPREQLRLMLQSLLADRFQLKLHRESRTGPVYRLTVAKGGPKLAGSDGGDLEMAGSPDGYSFRNAEVFRLAGYLSSFADRMVVDETGLTGLYNFTVKKPGDWGQEMPIKADRSPDSSTAAVFAEVLQPLGLQLVAGSAAVEYLVVDRVGPLSAN
jgi:uncharacterized protein (TIGR03435 family)